LFLDGPAGADEAAVRLELVVVEEIGLLASLEYVVEEI
jgi:hypothetical protein